MANGFEGYDCLSYKVELHSLIDFLVLMKNSIYDNFKFYDKFSVSFKPAIAEIKDHSSAV